MAFSDVNSTLFNKFFEDSDFFTLNLTYSLSFIMTQLLSSVALQLELKSSNLHISSSKDNVI